MSDADLIKAAEKIGNSYEHWCGPEDAKIVEELVRRFKRLVSERLSKSGP